MLVECGMRSWAKKVGQDVLINVASLAIGLLFCWEVCLCVTRDPLKSDVKRRGSWSERAR